MAENVQNSISKVSLIHSLTADFLALRLSKIGLPDFVSSHGNILFQLGVCESLTMKELAAKINRDKSTTTVLVRKLKDAALVQETPSPDDGRSKILSLTQKGRMYNQTTAEISEVLLKTFYKGFSEQEKAQFCDFLERIEKNFEGNA